MLRISSSGATDTGRRRSNNEDAFLMLEDLRLFAVADGIGGQEGGEVASGIAAATLRGVLPDLLDSTDRTPPEGAARDGREAAALLSAVLLANRNILTAMEERPELTGMGTTLTALLVTSRQALIVHVGDSRAYLLRSGNLRQLTSDHSLVAEQVKAGALTPEGARTSPLRHVITRALGAADTTPDILEQDIQRDDVYLLCSDGLTDMVDDRMMEQVLAASGPEEAVRRLIDAANEAGGLDNITVVVVKVLEI